MCSRNISEIPPSTLPTPPNSGHAVKPFMISEMYLIAAEAYLAVGESGNARSALQALQSARHAGLTEATEANIKNEWYRETVGDGLRMSCLKRWGEGFDGRAAQTGAEDVIQGLGTEYYDLRSIAATDHVFQWPIPAYEIQTNLNLVQNEGYGNASAE